MKYGSRYNSFFEDCSLRSHCCMCKLWRQIYVQMFDSSRLIIFKRNLGTPHNFIHRPNGSITPSPTLPITSVFIEQNMHTCLMIFPKFELNVDIELIYFIFNVYYYANLDCDSTIYDIKHNNESVLLSCKLHVYITSAKGCEKI